MMTEQELGQFFKPVEEELRLPVLDKEQLRDGVLVLYHGAKVIRDNTLHSFATLDLEENRGFQVWGTGALNQQLGKVKRGGIVFLAYRGKLADEKSGIESHRWTVNVSTRALADLPAELRATFRPVAIKLAAAIDAAATEEARKFAERVQRGQPGQGRAMSEDEAYWASLEQNG